MTLIAIFFPFLSFLLRGRLFTGIICLLLQITLIGWIPAAVWAVISLQNARADKRNNKLIKELRKSNRR
ncbi:MAG: YqaE/Pmp3 family membrane protein [Sediminibacterium sp.]|nr:YqaE/Pmp3 family membrane protein [Sediminibacterium sp.]MBX9780360.1 YqaE/Pmp3 family membrane protein [Chitinophagaceae bacterium]